MLVGPCRDFTCPHCGALYKLVRVPKFESNRLDYDRVPCVQCSRVLSPNVFMTKDPTTGTQARKVAAAKGSGMHKKGTQKTGKLPATDAAASE